LHFCGTGGAILFAWLFEVAYSGTVLAVVAWIRFID
jgi:hypothetical protein